MMMMMLTIVKNSQIQFVRPNFPLVDVVISLKIVDAFTRRFTSPGLFLKVHCDSLAISVAKPTLIGIYGFISSYKILPSDCEPHILIASTVDFFISLP
jgi:hypothetical protein